MNTILSLDFDGVLHPLPAALAVADTHAPIAELHAAGLFHHCQALEELLAGHPDVAVIVHSSWRLAHPASRLRELLGPLGHRVRDVTTKRIESREASIVDTLRRWHVPHSRVVVLDDDAPSFVALADRLVHCPSSVGVEPVLSQVDEALRRACA